MSASPALNRHAAPAASTRRRRSPHSLLAATVLLLCGVTGVVAQPDLPVTRLLFEPVPIAADGAEAGNLSALADLPGLVDGEAVDGRAPDADERRQINADIQGYIAAIGDKEAAEGPYSDQLTQDLFSVGQLYQRLAEHEQAVDYFERAQRISRVNEGQDSVAQAPLIRAKTDSLVALGRIREADEIQDELLQIYKDSYGEDSEEIVPAMLARGDWNLQAFLDRSNIALVGGRMDMQRFVSQSLASGGGQVADIVAAQTQPDAQQPIYKLFQAQNDYFAAIKILLDDENYSHPDLLELERKLTTTAFLRTHQESIAYEPDFYLERRSSATGTRIDTSSQELLDSKDYDVGLQSIQRSLAYISQNPERTHEQVAAAMLAEADWHLLFDRKVVARKKYEEIFAFFAANPAFGQYAPDTVYPAVPVVLPTLLPAPNSREKLGIGADEDVSYFGYFDVSFSVNRQGKARKIKINGRGGDVSKVVEMRLNEYLRKILFRPRYDKDGKLDDDVMQLRYYVGA